jgi:hypothetical protein
VSLVSRPKSSLLVAYAAVGWWVAFAALSFYWAVGGTFGLTTLGESIESLAAEAELWFMTLVAVTGVMKLVPCLFVLSLIRPWGDRLPLKIRLVAVGTMGVLSVLYGGVNMITKILIVVGMIPLEEIDTAGFWGHLLIWDPIWVVGGVLLCVSAWNYRDQLPGKPKRS